MCRSLLFFCLCLALCSCRPEADAGVEEFNLRRVTLPDGTVIRAEVNTKQLDMARGMMFRDSLPDGRGMLFVHGAPDKYSYYMFQTLIPLDIIWMDARGKVVEISENTPPCTAKKALECPVYGGQQTAMVVLELPGGYGRKHRVAVGEVIKF